MERGGELALEHRARIPVQRRIGTERLKIHQHSEMDKMEQNRWEIWKERGRRLGFAIEWDAIRG
jgi:hypothetical protein